MGQKEPKEPTRGWLFSLYSGLCDSSSQPPATGGASSSSLKIHRKSAHRVTSGLKKENNTVTAICGGESPQLVHHKVPEKHKQQNEPHLLVNRKKRSPPRPT